MDFNGKYLIKIQAKSQVVMPAKLRDADDENSVFPRTFYLYSDDFIGDGNEKPSHKMILYPVAVWNDVVQKLEERLKAVAPKDAKNKIRILRSSVEKIELDPQNRFTLRKDLLDAAGIGEKDVYFVGAGNCIEIWQKSVFDKFVKSHEQSLKQSLNELFDEI